jgi:kynurenine formamidase
MSRSIPTQSEVDVFLLAKRNWGRWGDDDQRGTLNLINDSTRLVALSAVRHGHVVSLSRKIPTWAGPGNSYPAQHYMKTAEGYGQNTTESSDRPSGGAAFDYYGMFYHGVNITHLDALCHMWAEGQMYNGRSPDEHITFQGATFGGVEQLADGVFTRGVILDIPRFRGTEFVDQDNPVHGWELEAILEQRHIELRPGDAVCVYSGRERWQASNPDMPYGRHPIAANPLRKPEFAKPGLHASCLPFLRDHDVSALLWDMIDMTPYEYNVPATVHGAIQAYGLILIDNALLEPLADTCRQLDQDDFLIVISPLVIDGGTGSPVNPLAVL